MLGVFGGMNHTRLVYTKKRNETGAIHCEKFNNTTVFYSTGSTIWMHTIRAILVEHIQVLVNGDFHLESPAFHVPEISQSHVGWTNVGGYPSYGKAEYRLLISGPDVNDKTRSNSLDKMPTPKTPV